MMPNTPDHCGVLTIRNPEFLSGLSRNPSQGSVVRVADERAKMVRDVMIQTPSQPAHQRPLGGIIGGRGEDVIHAVVKLIAIHREVGGIDGVCRLEDQRYAQTDDHMDQKEGASDQQGRTSQHQYGKDQHVCEIEELTGKENNVFAERMPGALQVVVGGKEETLEVSEKHVVQREQRIHKQRVDVLKAMQR